MSSPASAIPASKRAIKAILSLNGAIHNYRATVHNFLALQRPPTPEVITQVDNVDKKLRTAYNRLHNYFASNIVEMGPHPSVEASKTASSSPLQPYSTPWLQFVHNPGFIDLYTRTIFRPDLDLNSLIHITALVAAELRVPGWIAGEGRLHIAGVMWQKLKNENKGGLKNADEIIVTDTMIITAVQLCCEPRYMALKRLLDMYATEYEIVKESIRKVLVPNKTEKGVKIPPELVELTRKEDILRTKQRKLKEFILEMVMEDNHFTPSTNDSSEDYYREKGLDLLLNDPKDLAKLNEFTAQLDELIDQKRKNKLNDILLVNPKSGKQKKKGKDNSTSSGIVNENTSVTIHVQLPPERNQQKLTTASTINDDSGATTASVGKKMKKFKTTNPTKKNGRSKAVPYVTTVDDHSEDNDDKDNA